MNFIKNYYTSIDANDAMDLEGLQQAYEELLSKGQDKPYRLNKNNKQHTEGNWEKVLNNYRACGSPGHKLFVDACEWGRQKGNTPKLFITAMTGKAAENWVMQYQRDAGDMVVPWGTEEDYDMYVDDKYKECHTLFEDYREFKSRLEKVRAEDVKFERFLMDITSQCPTVIRLCYLICIPDMKPIIKILWKPWDIANMKEIDKDLMLDEKLQKRLEKYFKGVSPWINYLYSLPAEEWLP
jgi:hypothetical protein